jgi:FHS family L-fucose permease-like MFS transporter
LNAEASAVQTPFLWLAVALFVLAGIISLVKLPIILSHNEQGGYAKALRDKRLVFGAIAILLYVGAEVTIGTYLTNYFKEMGMAEVIRSNALLSWISTLFNQSNLDAIDDKAVVGAFVTLYWGAAMVGRFVGAFLTNIIKPSKVLSVFAVVALLLVIVSANSVGLVAFWSILSVGFFNSIMFPTIFTISIEGLGDLKPQGSGILCTAIVGGALIPPLFGHLTDDFGFRSAFILVMVCYVYIFFFSSFSHKYKLRP